MSNSAVSGNIFIDAQLVAARQGQASAFYELGLAYSVGRHGAGVDLVEAHKWFNLAFLSGITLAQEDRAEVAAEMSRAEIAEAQRRARAWLDGIRAVNASRIELAA